VNHPAGKRAALCRRWFPTIHGGPFGHRQPFPVKRQKKEWARLCIVIVFFSQGKLKIGIIRPENPTGIGAEGFFQAGYSFNQSVYFHGFR
jgi:hypothetical protein